MADDLTQPIVDYYQQTVGAGQLTEEQFVQVARDNNITDDQLFAAQQKIFDDRFAAEQQQLDAAVLERQTSVTTDLNNGRRVIEDMQRAEQEALRKLQADFAAQQAAIQAAAAAQAAQLAAQQAALQKQIEEIKRQQEAAAAKFKEERDAMQRESAERDAAGRKAGRTAGARPLLAGADMTPDATSTPMGSAAALGGTAGTLGGATALGGM